MRRHRSKPGIVGRALVILAMLAALDSGAAEAAPEGEAAQSFVPGEVIMRFEPGASAVERRAALTSVAGTVEEVLPVSGMRLVSLGSGPTVAEAVRDLDSRPGVVYAEPNAIVRAATTIPDDPLFEVQWGLLNTGQSDGLPGADIGATKAWDRGTGDRAVTVGVIDTGIALAHPDLAGNLWTNVGETPGNGVDDDVDGYVDDVNGYDFIAHEPDPTDANGHGTHVAGIVGADGNNAAGIAGVNWRVRLAALQALGADNRGPASALIEAIAYAGERGFAVVNGSLGGMSELNGVRDALIASSDTLFVFAAGNSANNNDASPDCPSCYQDLPNVISVAATTRTDGLAQFSNYGAATVNLGAPGVGIVSTERDGGYGLRSGTSQAAPHVAGAAALLSSLAPGASASALEDRILSTVEETPALAGRVSTNGRLDVDAATALPPPNDKVADATPLGPALPVSFADDNLFATVGTGEPAHGWLEDAAGRGPVDSVWYSWTPSADTDAVVDVCDSEIVTRVGVYTGPGGSLTRVPSQVPITSQPYCTYRWQALAGTQYSIGVGGSAADTEGSFTFDLHEFDLPNTKIANARIRSEERKATFKFEGSGTPTAFECKLSGQSRKLRRFKACRSPKTYKHLKRRKHVFYVRAVCPDGPDPTPAKKKFTIG